jgi:A/G-specific adenine glycosylase
VKGAVSLRGVTSLRKSLLIWYDAQRRDWPWRRSRDPYRIWVAEVMLQQTRIAVVVPAYSRFLRRFPTLSRLARADEDSVLAAWSGLGYYSRARALHRAARLLHARAAREFPRNLEAALALPGVGKYTAAAVLSIAYEQPLAAVDGNVIRVLSRLGRLPRPDAKNEPHQTLADRLLARDRPGDWNQALMELGQTVCLPTSPLCRSCPVCRHCSAYENGDVAAFPVRRQRRSTEQVRVEMTLTRDRFGNVLLERGAFPFLAHLWLPPLRVIAAPADRPAAPNPSGRRVGSFRHSILHRAFHVDVYSRVVSDTQIRREAGRRVAGGVERRLFDDAGLARIGRSSLLSKALRHAG